MPKPRSVRRPLAISAAALLGVGLIGVGAAPASAAVVGDTTALNNAIAANDPLIELSADFTLDADIAPITYDVEIVGNGFEIDADGWEAFDITGSATVTGITVVDANTEAFTVALGAGDSALFTDVHTVNPGDEGISASLDDAASLTVTGSTFTGGYGILINDEFGTATASISESTFEDTYVAIDVDDLYGTSSVDITNVTIDDAYYGVDAYAYESAIVTITGVGVLAGSTHNAGAAGYGIYLYVEDDAQMMVTQSSVIGDPDGDRFGYGLETYQYDAGSVVISESAFYGNDYNLYIDAYDPDTYFALLRSTVEAANYNGIYICDLGGTGIIDETTFDANGQDGYANLYAYVYSGTTDALTISRSTLSNGLYGGMDLSIYSGSVVTVVDSTISGNQSIGESKYGAIYVWGDSSEGLEFRLLNSTVTANTGVWAALEVYGVAATVSHSILSGNSLVADDNGELYVGSSAAAYIEWSLLGSAFVEEGGLYTVGEGLQVTSNPGVGPLADNGGPTLTHLLLPGSPALNTGDPAIVDPPATDQRGEARIQGGRIDIGAVEVTAALPATGAQSAPWLIVAGALLLLGAGLVVARRLRLRAA